MLDFYELSRVSIDEMEKYMTSHLVVETFDTNHKKRKCAVEGMMRLPSSEEKPEA